MLWAVYILFANDDMEIEDAVMYPGELKAVEEHYNTIDNSTF